MFFFFDETEKGSEARKEETVRARGAYDTRAPGIPELEVTCPYGDITMIIAMLHDYIKALDEVKGEDIEYQAYYRKRFAKMADRLSEQIGYDYDAMVRKCEKKLAKQEKDNDIGEEAMLLALKRGARSRKEEKPEETNEDESD